MRDTGKSRAGVTQDSLVSHGKESLNHKTIHFILLKKKENDDCYMARERIKRNSH